MQDVLSRAPPTSALLGLLPLIVCFNMSAAGAQEMPPEPPCPLTQLQAQAAARAFEAMRPVLQHPRCLNCHGGFGDIHENLDTLHPGGYISEDEMARNEDACTSCHTRAHPPPGAERRWELPRPSMFFKHPPIQICRKFKTTGNGTGDAFIKHVLSDFLIKLGFEGRKGQDEKPEPPPIPHGDFINLAKAWVAAAYGTSDEEAWKRDFPGADSPCGCDPNVFTPASEVWVRKGPFFASNGRCVEQPSAAVECKPKILKVTDTSMVLASERTGRTNKLEWKVPPESLTVGQDITLTLNASSDNEGPLVGGWWNIKGESDGKGDKSAGSSKNYRLSGSPDPHSSTYTFKFTPGSEPYMQVSGGNDWSPEMWVLVTYKYERQSAVSPPASEPTGAGIAPPPVAVPLPGLPASAALEYDTDRPGGDYRSFDLSTDDPRVCAAQCANEAPCRAWTYVKPGTQGPSARCWLKDRVPSPVAAQFAISAIRAGSP